ncbi:beta-propeller repeat protein [Leptospira noguchii serovar Autumnalis str. ZUN142]|uniref:Beta-propeller repeat protein n=1 Tax=Leptospira noguchii serovar Autumnalis str. ZUN142 TaxID=1085540 RepID=M6URK8_9LEPT|nr:beta-propeller repeat protein [Leptospira noguchii serovar Autumnalis str. ZUN142]
MAGTTSQANGIRPDSSGNVYTIGYTLGNLDGQILTGIQDLFVTNTTVVVIDNGLDF